jgi:hypothetical protein
MIKLWTAPQLLPESDAYAVCGSPHDQAIALYTVFAQDKREASRYSERACDLKARAYISEIFYDAIYRARPVVENDRCGLENPAPMSAASLDKVHAFPPGLPTAMVKAGKLRS